MRTFIVCTILVFCCLTNKAQTFQVEEDFKRIKPSKELLDALKESPTMKDCLKRNNDIKFSAKLFQIAKIDLNDDKVSDFIVKANRGNICLMGANIGEFLFFLQTKKGFELVLQVSELGVFVSDEKTKDFKNIETFRATAVKGIESLYVWNGKRYKFKKGKVSNL